MLEAASMGLLDWIRGPKRQPPLSISDTNFVTEVAKSDVPVIIDVWSPGCGPCKHLEPVFFEMAARYEGRVKVCELNTHAAPRAAVELSIRATPTVVFIKGGREVERVTGVRSSLYYQQAIEELFGEPKEPVA